MSQTNPEIVLAVEEGQPIPVISPLLALLRSRKFIAAVLTLLSSAFFYAFPQFEAFRAPAVVLIGMLAFVLIGSIAYEDGKKEATEISVEPVESPEKDLRDLIEVVLDELLAKRSDGKL